MPSYQDARKGEADRLSRITGTYLGNVSSVNPLTQKAQIQSVANDNVLDLPQPYEGTNSWMRVMPDEDQFVLLTQRSDTKATEILRYYAPPKKSTSKQFHPRIQRYFGDENQPGSDPYRPLQPGEIDIHSKGMAGAFYGARPFQQTRGGLVNTWQDQDTLTSGAFAPRHNRQSLNHNAASFSDEESFGVVVRKKDAANQFYPKTLKGGYGKAWEAKISNYAGAQDLYWVRTGDVFDDTGTTENAKSTGLPLRHKSHWYTEDTPTVMSVEMGIDTMGNVEVQLPLSATHGLDIKSFGSIIISLMNELTVATMKDVRLRSSKDMLLNASKNIELSNLESGQKWAKDGSVTQKNKHWKRTISKDGDLLESNDKWKLTVAKNGDMLISTSKGSFALKDDGSWEMANQKAHFLATSDGTLKANNDKGSVTVDAGGKVTVTGGTNGVVIGDGTDPMVLGQQLVDFLGDLIDAIKDGERQTSQGPTTGLVNPAPFATLKGRAKQLLSRYNKVG